MFCQEFYAELVSIAGVFRVFETIPAELAGKPVQAWLAGEDLRFARTSAAEPKARTRTCAWINRAFSR